MNPLLSLRKRGQRVIRRAAVRYARWNGDLVVQLFDPANYADPFPTYAAMRAAGPIYRSRLTRIHVLTTYEGNAQGLRDARFKARRPEGLGAHEGAGLGSADSLLHIDPPRHTHLRQLLTKGFSLRAIEDMTPWVENLVHELLDNVEGRSEFDFVREVAFPLPVRVISHVLGVPPEHEDQLRVWGEDIIPTVEPMPNPAQLARGQEASREMIGYFRELVHDRQAHPRDNDVLTNLIAARSDEDGVALTEGELLAACQLMLVAGFGTSVGMLGSLMHLLVDRPDVVDELRAEPELVPTCIEEVLRLESPVQLTVRHVDEPVDVAGGRLPAGARVMVLMGGGNRDPEMFPDPDRLDLHRTNASRHLAFSPGIHHCLGAPLARLEGRLALSALLERMPAFTRGGLTRRLPHLNARVVRSVPVSVSPHVLSRSRTPSL